MISFKRVEVHKATIDIQLIIYDSGLMSKPPAEVVPGILDGGANQLECEWQQQCQQCLLSVAQP